MIQSAAPETPRPPPLRGKTPLHDLTVTAHLPSGTGQTTVSSKQDEQTGPSSIPASPRTSLREQPDSSVAEIGETCAQTGTPFVRERTGNVKSARPPDQHAIMPGPCLYCHCRKP